uniref:Translationally-controlled tumor protein n=1 Tax=Peromyscus maniculatus bairdii TaxID=230844 RepID=A0A8C8UGA2_PERMB
MGCACRREGKVVSRTEGNIDDYSIIDGDPSTKGRGRKYQKHSSHWWILSRTITYQKPASQKRPSESTSKIAGILSKANLETNTGRVKPLMTAHILANFKDYQFFTGENMNPDGMVVLLDYCEDGVTPSMFSLKAGLEREKC